MLQDYPDYYEVIKKPVDMQRVQQRMSGNQYETVEDMVADFVQMFDNACKYNEPDSLIYKVCQMFLLLSYWQLNNHSALRNVNKSPTFWRCIKMTTVVQVYSCVYCIIYLNFCGFCIMMYQLKEIVKKLCW